MKRDFQRESLRSYCSNELHVTLSRVVESVRAGVADPEIERMLGIDPGSPVLLASCISHDASGTPCAYIKWDYRADCYCFQTPSRSDPQQAIRGPAVYSS
jgi:DNA-binding GntR family transcriptional regulator